MDIHRNHLIAAFIVIAVVGAYLATRQTNKKAKVDQVELVRKAAESDCVRTSVRAALVLAFKDRAAQAASDRDEGGLDDEYRALALGGALLIPVPKDREDERQFISEVVRIAAPNGDRAYRLTDRATELIKQGCQETYAP